MPLSLRFRVNSELMRGSLAQCSCWVSSARLAVFVPPRTEIVAECSNASWLLRSLGGWVDGWVVALLWIEP